MTTNFNRHVTESIFSKDGYVIPMAEVQHTEPRPHGNRMIVMKSSTYNSEQDEYNNAICLPASLTADFLAAWCRYRAEVEGLIATQTEAAPAANALPWRSMLTAPTNGTIVRLLVDYSADSAFGSLEAHNPTSTGQTIGVNGDGGHLDDPEGRVICGWNWEHDCFTQGKGEPVGWLPFAAEPVAEPQTVKTADEATQRDAERYRYWRNKYSEKFGDADLTPENFDSVTDAQMLMASTNKSESALTQPVVAATQGVEAMSKEVLTSLIAEHLSGTLHCTRVWRSWSVGTMTERDFQRVSESSTPSDLADAILDAFSSQPPPSPAQTEAV